MADMLSQEEIDALLTGGDSDDSSSGSAAITHLTDDEKDALGEVGNISMGTAATTLFTLLGQKVTITTPRVSETNMAEMSKDFEDPLVMIHIKYKIGIEGLNLLILRESDVKIITDLMMGGDGETKLEFRPVLSVCQCINWTEWISCWGKGTSNYGFSGFPCLSRTSATYPRPQSCKVLLVGHPVCVSHPSKS